MRGGAAASARGPVARRRRLANRLGLSAGFALLVSDPLDVGYLSGFTGEDSYLLVGRGWGCLLTDGRFDEQAHAQCPDLEIVVRQGSMAEAIRQMVRLHRLRRVGFQPGHVTVDGRRRLEEALGAWRVRPVEDGLLLQRAVKDAMELAAIRRAARVAEKAFKSLMVNGLRWFVGRTERQVAAELDYRMRLAGADEPAFPTIVAAGAHSSLPHYRPADTRIRRDQVLLIDWGARKDGYCSDLTRVLMLGTIPPKLVGVYDVVLAAQQAGMAAVRAGVTGRTVDLAARSVIQKAGFCGQFIHGLGHGVGRAIHEWPALGSQVGRRLRRGMVVTVEPGVYLPGVGGVRIEDDVLVGPEGPVRLTSLPTARRAMLLA